MRARTVLASLSVAVVFCATPHLALAQSGAYSITASVSATPSFGTTSTTCLPTPDPGVSCVNVVVSATFNGTTKADSGTVRLDVTPAGSAPAIDMTTSVFTVSAPWGATTTKTSSSVAVFWSNTGTPVGGTTQVGVLTIPIPATARNTDTYSLSISFGDAANSVSGASIGMSTSGGTLSVTQTVSSFLKKSGDTQTGTVGRALTQPLVVASTDSNGVGVLGASVAFAVAAGGGSLANCSSGTPTAVLTDRSGQASCVLTLGTTAGPNNNTATATLNGQTQTFVASAIAGPPATLTKTAGDNQSAAANGAVPLPLQVTVRDTYGNVVPGQAVTFTANGGGLVNGSATANVNTNASGQASVNWTLGGSLAGQTVTATVNTLSVIFNGTVQVPVAATIAQAAGTTVQSAQARTTFANQICAVVKNNNAAVQGATVTFSVAPTTGTFGTLASSVTPTNPVTDGTGQACTTLSAGSKAQSVTVTAQISTSSSTPSVTFPEVVTAGNAAIIAKSGGDNQSDAANTAVPNALQVTVTDADGNFVSGTAVVFTAIGGGTVNSVNTGGAGSASQTVNTNSNGVTQVYWTLGGALSGQSVTAASAGLNGSPLTFNATVQLAASTQIAVAAGNNQSTAVTTAASNQVCVTVTNNSAAVVGATVSLTVSPTGTGSSAVNPTSVVTGANGLACTTFVAGTKAQVNTVTASIIVVGGSAVSTTFTETSLAGTPATLSKVSGDFQAGPVNGALGAPLVVRLADQYGNPVSGQTVFFAVGTNSGFVSTSSATNSSGQTQVNWTLGGILSSQSVTASFGSLTPVVFTAQVQLPATAQISVFSGNNQSASVTTAAPNPLCAVVTNNASNVVGATVVFSSNPSGTGASSVNPLSAITGSNGQACTTFTAGTKAQANQIVASIAVVGGGTLSTSFAETSTPGPLASLTSVSGNNQTGNTGLPLGNPFVVLAADQYSNGIAGITVVFAVASGGGTFGSGASTTVQTAANGLASATLTLGPTVGVNTATASAGSVTPITFTANGARTLQVSNSALSFGGVANAAIGSQSLTISSLGGSVNWLAVVSGNAGVSLSSNSGTTPSTITVNVSAPNAAGTYASTITITSAGASNSPLTVNVSLTLTAAGAIGLSVYGMNFTGTVGGANPAVQSLLIFGPTGNAALGVRVAAATSTGGNWLSVTPANGSTPLTANVAVDLSVISAPGTYSGTITVTSADAVNSPQTTNVTLIVAATPKIQLTPVSLSFTAYSQGSDPPSQTITASNIGGGNVTFSATASTTSGGSWLSVSNSGSVNTNISVSVSIKGLSAGTYNGSVSVAASGAVNTPQTVPVTLTINPAPLPNLLASPASLQFTGDNLTPQSVTVSNSGSGGAVGFVASVTTTGGAWLTVSPTTGSTPATLTVSAATSVGGSQLVAGVYSGTITITPQTGSSITINVSLTVAGPPPSLVATPTGLLFDTAIGGTPASQTFTLTNAGGGAAGFTITATTSSGGNWLSFSPTSGTTPATITVSAASSVGGTNLAQGGYSGTVTITPLAGSGGTTATVQVGLALAAPALEPGGLVDGAIFKATVGAGSIVSLFGVNLATATASATSTPLPTTLAGTQVMVNGKPVPLFYVSPNQINAQLPPGISGPVTLTVISGSITGVTTTVGVSAESPSIFLASAATSLQGAILNSDQSPNSAGNPAAAGSIIVIYATGLGPVNPALAAGQPGASQAPFNQVVDPLTVSINGQKTNIVFAAAAPGFVGLFQINAAVPANTPPGNAVPVSLTISGISSNTVTMCVRAGSQNDII